MSNKYSYIVISLVVLVFGFWVVPELVNRLNKNKLEVVSHISIPDFEFTNQYNQTITKKTYEDKIFIVEFFFTSCTTICPKMNLNLKKIENHFYGNNKIGFASLTVDPENDNPEVLLEYANKLGVVSKNWHFLTGNEDDIYDLANKSFNLYVNEDHEAPGGFVHSGMFALVDKKGLIRCRKDESGNPIIYYDGTSVEEVSKLIEDIELLLKE